jgi:hypothetical protein
VEPRHALSNHFSALPATDPELIDVFDNLAFDEVLEGSTLDVRTRLMVQLTAIVARRAVHAPFCTSRSELSSPRQPSHVAARNIVKG